MEVLRSKFLRLALLCINTRGRHKSAKDRQVTSCYKHARNIMTNLFGRCKLGSYGLVLFQNDWATAPATLRCILSFITIDMLPYVWLYMFLLTTKHQFYIFQFCVAFFICDTTFISLILNFTY